MELKQFVSKALEEILQGVNEAQQKVAGTHVGTVVPHIPEYENMEVPEHISCFQNVNFEIAVSVEEKTGSEASLVITLNNPRFLSPYQCSLRKER